MYQIMSRGQGEAKPRAAKCVELSRAEPERFASVWLFCIWEGVAGEMMSRKGKPGKAVSPGSGTQLWASVNMSTKS